MEKGLSSRAQIISWMSLMGFFASSAHYKIDLKFIFKYLIERFHCWILIAVPLVQLFNQYRWKVSLGLSA